MSQAGSKDRDAPDLDATEKQRVERANQIFLRLRKELHDRERQPAERDIREAVQGAQWLREVVERHSNGLEQAYEDALSESGLPEDDQAHLWKETEEAGVSPHLYEITCGGWRRPPPKESTPLTQRGA